MDRNHQPGNIVDAAIRSLSARRAWIEMLADLCTRLGLGVALRKESVDRNIPRGISLHFLSVVALRKESVDRNNFLIISVTIDLCRSPQGERG